MANIITTFRMLCSVLLLFCPVFSRRFYVLYVLCGVSDMVDGTVARRRNTASEFGAKLDTAADLLFTAAASFKLLPALPIPCWLWVWMGAIAAIKLWNILTEFRTRKAFLSLHTGLNKITGLLLFLLPLTLPFVDFLYSCAAVCAVATLAAVQEGVIIRKTPDL